MKKLYRITLFGVVAFASFTIQAQNQNMGIGTTQPDKSAVLDIKSEDKGLLIPRMRLEQRNLINNPANGLLIYQIGENEGFYYYNDNSWRPLSTTEAKSVKSDPNDWSFTGNAAPANAFIGTTNSTPLIFKVNNVIGGQLKSEITSFGLLAGYNNSVTGLNNTAIGSNALYTNSTGDFNLAIGSNALRVGTANYNTAIGVNSLYSTTSGQYNMAIGATSMFKNVSGDRNLAFGISALYNSVSGSDNVAIGGNSLLNTLGSANIAVGYNSGRGKNGSGSIYLGNEAGYSASTISESNVLYIGNSSTTTPLIKGSFDGGNVKINVKPQVGSNTSTLGFLAIGDFSDVNFNNVTKVPVTGNGYRLYVQDGVLTEKLKVALKSTADWADYVFEDDYKKNMMPLEDIEKFTAQNKHLPNVPSAGEMASQGLDVGQTSKMFMEKIEELTIYMIELNKEVKSLKIENEVLKAKLK
jgi:hypothetical protein